MSRPLSDPTSPLLWLRRDASKEGDDGGVVQIDATRTVSAQSRRTALQAPLLTQFPQVPEGEALRYFTLGNGVLSHAINTLGGKPFLWKWEAKTWTKCNLDLQKYTILGTTDHPDEVIAAPHGEAGMVNTVVRLNTSTGVAGEPLVSDKDYGLSEARLLRAEDDGHILGISYSRAKPTTVWLDAEAAARSTKLDQLLPGLHSFELSRSSKAACSIVGARSDLLPVEYQLYDHASGKLTPLGKSRPWIAPERMQPMHCLNYVASDGLRIDAMITLPRGATRQKSSPLIVLVENSFFLHTTWGWHPVVQLLASRGYAVLQVSYRGTHLPGRKFNESSPLVLTRIQADINEGVQFLVRSGVADPTRIALLGEGLGAYLALGCAVSEPTLYRCSISLSGSFNWHRMLSKVKRYDASSEIYKRAERSLGDPARNRQQFEEISPLGKLPRLRGPVLVVHSERPGTSKEESTDLVKALQKDSIPVEKLLLEGTPSNKAVALENQVATFTAVEGFLARNMAQLPLPEQPPK